MWMREYGKCPEEVDDMSMNSVFSIIYARLVQRINKRFSDVIKTGSIADEGFHNRFGD
jgi:hypothetical protein